MIESDLQFVHKLLKRFGTLIYTGNPLDDLVLMELELEDLFEWKLITDDEFLKARLILRKAANNR